ncbi:hypothetical protein HPP92_010468 [Vanilla planifolia]|uniref:Uncharacterized protein n=1 Tax=Vanilla planifolia TaxID=51239 RepID=A0A835R571_VANPL|nr:hypothetical protein HPP92_010468 [Vanilla planifolia]
MFTNLSLIINFDLQIKPEFNLCFIEETEQPLMAMLNWIRVANPLPAGRKDHEDNAGEHPRTKRQINQQLLRIGRGAREKAALRVGIAESQRQENQHAQESVQPVHPPPPPPPENILSEHLAPLLLAAVEVEQTDPIRRRHAVVEAAVSPDEAVGEGEEGGGDDAGQEEGGGQALVGGVAVALVCETGSQGLEGEKKCRWGGAARGWRRRRASCP